MKPRMFKSGRDWVVRGVLQDKGLVGVICIGRARSMRAAWNDYCRKYNWFKRGCPGMSWYRPKREIQSEKDALKQAIKGP